MRRLVGSLHISEVWYCFWSEKLLITNWYNLVEICIMVLPRSDQILVTFDHKIWPQKMPIAWKLLVRFRCNFIWYCVNKKVVTLTLNFDVSNILLHFSFFVSQIDQLWQTYCVRLASLRGWIILRLNFRLKVMFYANIYVPLDRGMVILQLCCWKFSHKETL